MTECHIGFCDEEAVREAWSTRGESWLPCCGEHFPKYTDRERVREL